MFICTERTRVIDFLLMIQIPEMFLEKEYLTKVLMMELQCGQNATVTKDPLM